MKCLPRILTILGAIAATIFIEPAQAQPANDNFEEAIVLDGPIVTTSGSNVGATKPFGPGGEPSIPPQSIGTFGGASVWWNWTAVASGQTTIDTDGSDFNTLLGVFTGEAVNQLTLVAGSDDYQGNPWSRVEFDAVAGVTYHIMVDGYRSGPGFGSPATGNIVLHVQGIGGLTITTPSEGMVFTVGDPIPIALTVDDDFPNPPATRVDFFLGDTLVSSSTEPPFTAVANNAAAGSNRVYAVAYDNANTPIQSVVVPIFVQNIGVTLLSPNNGTTFTTEDPITISAWAYLPTGSITNIEFFVDNRKIGESSTAPFAVVWDPVESGSHRLTAVGRSDSGVSYNSQPVNIALPRLLLSSGSVWSYLDDGSDQASAWREPGFDDSTWASGPAEFGYGDGDEATVVESGPEGDTFITTYFRTSMEVTNVAAYTNLLLNVKRDDGAIVYFNGVEAARFNMPTGAVDYLTDALNAGDDGAGFVQTTIPASFLVEGENVIAVEIHQAGGTSSDISFDLFLRGVPPVIYNDSPTITFSPANNEQFLQPTVVPLSATAADTDGEVVKVEFYADGVKLSEDESAPYEGEWLSPSIGRHLLTAVAIDDAGGAGIATASVVVFDTVGTPLVQLLSPPDGFLGDGPTNLVLSVDAVGYGGVANVSYYNHGTDLIASVDEAPFSFLWIDATFGTNEVTAVVTDVNGLQATSAVATVTVIAPPPNLATPRILGISPAPGSTVSSLSAVRVTFSEAVMGLEPSDLLANGVPARGILALGNIKIFSFPLVGYGTVNFSWNPDHRIGDLGYPTFYLDENAPGATWSYTIIDAAPPVVASQTPSAYSTVSSLTNLALTFNETVTGVDAADLLINSRPATMVSGAGSNYVFTFPSPSPGEVAISWVPAPGIVDSVSNAFNPTGFGAIWTYNFDNRTILVATNSMWQFMKGLSEASTPTNAWRFLDYDASGWSNAPAPFYWNDPYDTEENPGTELSDLPGNYSSIFLRQSFEIPTLKGVTSLMLTAQSDDGFIAWINGTEVLRYNMPAGEVPFNGNAASSVTEVNQSGVSFRNFTLPVSGGFLEGLNVLTVQAFNAPGGGNNQDFGFNAQLTVTIPDPTLLPPTVQYVAPLDYIVYALQNITVEFSEPVSGVNASDLLINGVPANNVLSDDETIYQFELDQPAYGPVTITWAAQPGIVDFDELPRSFDGTFSEAHRSYYLVDPNGPYVLSQTPPADATMTNLTELTVTFSEPVVNVDASDLLINGVPAESASGAGDTYTFGFAQPPYGQVLVTWAANQDLTDEDAVPVPFVPIRPGDTWKYDFQDPIPPLFLTRGPYLQVGTPTSGMIRWRTHVPSDAVVRYGPSPDELTNLIERTSMTNEHMVTISGLEPATRYYYSIASSFRTLMEGTNSWFVTSPLPGTPQPTRIWVLGDSGTANQDAVAVRDAYHNWTGTNGGPADLWLMLGDNAYNSGTDSEYQRAVFDLYTNTLPNLFLWPALGNHETAQSTTAESFPYLDIFSFPEQGEAGGIPSGARKYYSFDYANIHFVCLDTMTSTRSGTSPMANWLRQDLASTVQDWIIVFFHHPPYTKGSHDSDAENDLVQIRQNLVPIFEEYAVDLVLSGHSHCFERSYFLNGHYGNSSTFSEVFMVNPGDGREDGDGAYKKNAQGEGVVYTVAGSSGQATFGSLDHPAHFISLLELGSLVIDVDSTRLDMRFIGADSIAADHVTLLKADFAKPEAPLDLVAIENSATEIALAWTDVATNELGFFIERSTDGVDFEVVGEVSADATETIDNGIIGGITYYYRVAAWNRDERSEYSNVASVTTIDPSSFPRTPTFLVASADNGVEFYRSQMILSWRDNSTNEVGTRIERSVDGLNFEEIGVVGADVTLYLDRDLDSATRYHYRVQAYNAVGASSPSLVASDSTHPQSLLVAEGTTVTFHAGVEGAPPVTYQWRYLDVPLFGQTNETLVVENVFQYDEGDYSVDITDASGVMTSNPAYLFVVAPPVIVVQPVDTLVQAGDTAMLTVAVNGIGPFTYIWRKEGVMLEAENSPTLSLAGVQAEDAGAYDVIVISDFGTLTSSVAHLTVNHPPVALPDVVYRFFDGDVAVEISQLLANDSDVDGNPLQLLSVSERSTHDGEVSVVGRYVFYVANPSWTEPDSFSYSITDSLGGLASSMVSIEISSNTPPVIAPMENILAAVMQPVLVTTAAADEDVPANNLAFSLAEAPANSTIDPATGRFLWSPLRSEAATTNMVTVEVVDDGIPSLSNAVSFSIVVRDYLEVTMGSAVVRSGAEGTMPLELTSSTDLEEIQLLIQYPPAQLDNLSIELVSPDLATVQSEAVGDNALLVTFRRDPSQPLPTSPIVARMRFDAAGESAFVNLTPQDVICTRATLGLEPSMLIHDGRVAIVGNQSLLEARLTVQGLRELYLYGVPGTAYTIEYSNTVEDPSSWKSWQTVIPTALETELSVDESFETPLFFRLRE